MAKFNEDSRVKIPSILNPSNIFQAHQLTCSWIDIGINEIVGIIVLCPNGVLTVIVWYEDQTGKVNIGDVCIISRIGC